VIPADRPPGRPPYGPGSLDPGAPARPTRVLVVEDSPVQRAVLIALLEADPELEVAGWAADGLQAVQAVARLRPDVVAMDLRMPRLDGLEASRRIMHQTPTPIVLITAAAQAGGDERLAYDALQAGALTLVPKPSVVTTAGALDLLASREAQDLLRAIKSMAQVKVVRRRSPDRPAAAPPAAPLPAETPLPTRPLQVVAVGASTGGPQALSTILPQLPATFPLPVLVVQHISDGFAAGLVAWLSTRCALPVNLATPGWVLDRPGVVVAPTGQHLVVHGRTVLLSDEPPLGGHRPSATVLFRSVARAYGAGAVAVLLSGMGDDGAAGLRDLKRAGGVTVAQDEASCVVFGMPGAAVALGAVDHVLPPAAIAPRLVDLARRPRPAPGA
jgi:two-component system chemotaxis response regulator CheB